MVFLALIFQLNHPHPQTVRQNIHKMFQLLRMSQGQQMNQPLAMKPSDTVDSLSKGEIDENLQGETNLTCLRVYQVTSSTRIK